MHMHGASTTSRNAGGVEPCQVAPKPCCTVPEGNYTRYAVTEGNYTRYTVPEGNYTRYAVLSLCVL